MLCCAVLQLREQLLASSQAGAGHSTALSAAEDSTAMTAAALYGTQAQSQYVLPGVQSSSVEALQGHAKECSQRLELQMRQLSLRSSRSTLARNPSTALGNGQNLLMDNAATSQPHVHAQACAQPVRSNCVQTSMRDTDDTGGTYSARRLSFNKQAAAGCSFGDSGPSLGMHNCKRSASLPLGDARPLIGSFQERCGYLGSNVGAAREPAAGMHAEQQGVVLRAAAAEKMEQLAAIQRLQLELQQELLHMSGASPHEPVM